MNARNSAGLPALLLTLFALLLPALAFGEEAAAAPKLDAANTAWMLTSTARWCCS